MRLQSQFGRFVPCRLRAALADLYSSALHLARGPLHMWYHFCRAHPSRGGPKTKDPLDPFDTPLRMRLGSALPCRVSLEPAGPPLASPIVGMGAIDSSLCAQSVPRSDQVGMEDYYCILLSCWAIGASVGKPDGLDVTYLRLRRRAEACSTECARSISLPGDRQRTN